MADSYRSNEARQRKLEKQRLRMKQDFEKRKEEIVKANSVNLRSDKFVNDNSLAEDELKTRMVGFVKLEDFQKLKEDVHAKGNSCKRTKRRQDRSAPVPLSFENDEVLKEQSVVPKKIKKNPSVDTSFLPDEEREAWEKQEKERLRSVWLAKQEAVKNEKILVTFSYWDGAGHRKQVECRKGDRISTFLENCRQLFPKLAKVPVDRLMYIKEDLIIPHEYSFYDFIINKARGKSGPLFDFSVKEDVRIVNDVTRESVESHAGKVVERHWYERHKHIFPASRWEPFDPSKDYGNYKIKD